MRLRTLRSVSYTALLAGISLASPLFAAGTVTIQSPQDASSQNFDLTSLGTADWLKWADTNPNSVFRMNNSPFSIGTFLAINPNGFPVTFDTSPDVNSNTSFHWNNGDSTLPTTNSQTGSVGFDTISQGFSGSTFGTGFQFTIFPDSPSGTLRFWGMSASADAELSAQLENASNVHIGSAVVNDQFLNPGSFFGYTYASDYYDVKFSGLSTGDKIVLQYTVATDNGDDLDGHGYVGLEAAALKVDPVPEPASLSALGLAGVGLLLRRRRRA